jgi:hypothetical protein
MSEPFGKMLTAGGKKNSLGRVNEVITVVLQDKTRLQELYDCLMHQDAWVRMRAADALEKISRQHPDWLAPYVDRFATDLATSTQASIQWHLAQIYQQVPLNPAQKAHAITWLQQLLSTKEVDWIAASYAMDTLAGFTKDGAFSATSLSALLRIQAQHKSKAVVKRANKLLQELSRPS